MTDINPTVPTRPRTVVDLFCGAGGASEGVAQACEELGMERPALIAVNHWSVAVETHRRNHPWAQHYCARVESIDPRAAVGGPVDLIVAGVECTHHSQARGGAPMNDQSRSSAWNVLHWAEMLRAQDILIENVPEFLNWGPLDDKNRPIRERRGETFRALVCALESLNYRVEWRVLNAADYGDPQRRRRLFLRARRGGGRIQWPVETHGPLRAPYRTAREIIDWSDLGTSIFRRNRPLSPRTRDRIAEGIRRFCGAYADPFLVMLYGTGTVRSIDLPLPTVTSGGGRGGGHIGLAQPFLVPRHGEREGQRPRTHGLDAPSPTITATNAPSLITPFILPHDQFVARNGLSLVDGIDEPMRTVKGGAGAAGQIVMPFLQHVTHTQDAGRVHPIDMPVPTVTAAHRGELAFVVPYYRTGVPYPASEPLHTLTTHDRFALVTPDGVAMDIYSRMLKERELARAQSFPDAYHFTGTKSDVVKQIGNAWPVELSKSLARSVLSEEA